MKKAIVLILFTLSIFAYDSTVIDRIIERDIKAQQHNIIIFEVDDFLYDKNFDQTLSWQVNSDYNVLRDSIVEKSLEEMMRSRSLFKYLDRTSFGISEDEFSNFFLRRSSLFQFCETRI